MAQVNYLTDEQSLFMAATPENFALLESEGRGPLTSNIPEAAGFFRTRAGLDAPDVEFHFAPSMFFDEGLTAPSDHGYCFGPVVINPTSRGRVMLRAPLAGLKAPRPVQLPDDRRGPPEHDRRHADRARDRRAGSRCARSSGRRSACPSPTRTRTCWRSPGAPAQSVYHPTSTCAMGAVVDSELRVYGVRGAAGRRRLGDAAITRANTNAPTIMIAETRRRPDPRRRLGQLALELAAGQPAGAATVQPLDLGAGRAPACRA